MTHPQPHLKHPTKMLTTRSHLIKGIKKYPDENPISYRNGFRTCSQKQFFEKNIVKKFDYFRRRGGQTSI